VHADLGNFPLEFPRCWVVLSLFVVGVRISGVVVGDYDPKEPPLGFVLGFAGWVIIKIGIWGGGVDGVGIER